MACINLAMHSAITTDKTYLADKESTQQKFIGYGCLSSSACIGILSAHRQ